MDGILGDDPGSCLSFWDATPIFRGFNSLFVSGRLSFPQKNANILGKGRSLHSNPKKHAHISNGQGRVRGNWFVVSKSFYPRM